MPLMIDYSWTHAVDRVGARSLVAAMREAALKLPFVSVGEIIEEEWGPEQVRDPERDDDLAGPPMTEAELEAFMRRWPGRWFVRGPDGTDSHMAMIEPVWACYFVAQLNGCDPVTAGLAEHVETVKLEHEYSVEEVSTNLDGKMAWRCKCETLNAMLPQLGGWDNFFKQHTTALKLIEAVEKLGLEPEVWDQGGYWETLNPDLLREELERSAAITAHTIGHLKDRLNDDPDLAEEMPLLKHPQFERLEAKGAEIMAQGPHPSVRRFLEQHEEGEEWKRGRDDE
jgi:hypothetical protein